MQLFDVTTQGFRNLTPDPVSFGAGITLVAGENAQGKTNLLEAVYVLATSRSFRTPRLFDLVAEGAEVASVRAAIAEAGEPREQSVGVRRGARAVRIDGRRHPDLDHHPRDTGDAL